MTEARSICQQHGENWDLASINLAHEYSYLSDLLRGNCITNTSFWLGYHYHGNDDNIKPSFNSQGDHKPLRKDRKTGEFLTSVFNYSSMCLIVYDKPYVKINSLFKCHGTSNREFKIRANLNQNVFS